MAGREHTSSGTGTTSWHPGSLGSSIHPGPQTSRGKVKGKVSRDWQGKARGFWKDEAAVLVDQGQRGDSQTPEVLACLE